MDERSFSSSGATPVDAAATLDLRMRRAHQVARHVAAGDYVPALQLLESCGHDAPLQNVKGVCLLRSGQAAEAIQLYRKLVLQPGCTWTRRELPLAYKLNFATALLMGGHPAGCLDILGELRGCEHATITRLHAAIRVWEHTLGFWRRWDWRIGRVEPKNCALRIDFVPGEFAPGDLPAETPQHVSPDRPPRAAA